LLARRGALGKRIFAGRVRKALDRRRVAFAATGAAAWSPRSKR
jgi:hypothetical protein